jgi:hypothetical protein
LTVASAGVYTVGLYDSPDVTETNHLFPLPVAKFNPLARTAPANSTRL